MAGNIVNVSDVQLTIIDLASRSDDVIQRLHEAKHQAPDPQRADDLLSAAEAVRAAWSQLVIAASGLYMTGIGRPVTVEAVSS